MRFPASPLAANRKQPAFLLRELRLLPVLASLAMPLTPATATSMGDFDGHTDVGAPKIAGSAEYDPATQSYAITASGTNLWADHDEFHFAYRRLDGDFILRTRAAFDGAGVEPHRKMGWIARASLDADAPYVDCAEHGSGLTSLQFRLEKGGATREFQLPVTHADVLQFERRGDTYIFSAARFGEPFTTAEIQNSALTGRVYAGLFVCAHNPRVKEVARFRDVRIIRPAKAGFRPYRDYVGSALEILDVRTGDLRRVRRSSEPFEAPNWTPGGRALIYNVSGAGPRHGIIERFDLATGAVTPVETGPAVHNNNDHVLSFDGAMLGLSNQGPETDGKSAIYVVPSTGGTPRLVTHLTPSYLHGWSPDGRWLVYTAGRPEKPGGSDVYSIYKIPVAGGAEIRLTRSAAHDDGPEFSPDGKRIYFNSTRSGHMQIWRMNPDGTGQEQVTGDAYNNWFPHVSPDGKRIVFLSYPPDIAPDDHPYYRQVYVRTLPTAEDAPPRIVAYVYGGQGTINVPSWSPDSRRIAFVSNSD